MRGDVDLTRIALRGALTAWADHEEGGKPGDHDNVNRDNLVFRGETMHLVSTNHRVGVYVNPEPVR